MHYGSSIKIPTCPEVVVFSERNVIWAEIWVFWQVNTMTLHTRISARTARQILLYVCSARTRAFCVNRWDIGQYKQHIKAEKTTCLPWAFQTSGQSKMAETHGYSPPIRRHVLTTIVPIICTCQGAENGTQKVFGRGYIRAKEASEANKGRRDIRAKEESWTNNRSYMKAEKLDETIVNCEAKISMSQKLVSQTTAWAGGGGGGGGGAHNILGSAARSALPFFGPKSTNFHTLFQNQLAQGQIRSPSPCIPWRQPWGELMACELLPLCLKHAQPISTLIVCPITGGYSSGFKRHRQQTTVIIAFTFGCADRLQPCVSGNQPRGPLLSKTLSSRGLVDKPEEWTSWHYCWEFITVRHSSQIPSIRILQFSRSMQIILKNWLSTLTLI